MNVTVEIRLKTNISKQGETLLSIEKSKGLVKFKVKLSQIPLLLQACVGPEAESEYANHVWWCEELPSI